MNRLSSIPSSTLNAIEQQRRPSILQHLSAEQQVLALKEKFKSALIDIATKRKVVYDIIVDLKEHFHEYGFNSPADAVTAVCQRSKSWANKFVAEIEAELQIYSRVATTVATPPSPNEQHKLETLKTVAKLPDPLSKGGSIDTVAAPDKSTKNATECSNNGSGAERNETVTAAVAEKDLTGLTIPECALKTWALRDTIQELISLSSKLRCALDKAFQEYQYLFHPRRWDEQIHREDLNTIHYQLTQVKPEVLCPICNGTIKDDMGRDCGECCRTGFISKSRWHNEYEKSRVSFVQTMVSTRTANASA